MSGWQLEAFDNAYKEIIETGSSPIKNKNYRPKRLVYFSVFLLDAL